MRGFFGIITTIAATVVVGVIGTSTARANLPGEGDTEPGEEEGWPWDQCGSWRMEDLTWRHNFVTIGACYKTPHSITIPGKCEALHDYMDAECPI